VFNEFDISSGVISFLFWLTYKCCVLGFSGVIVAKVARVAFAVTAAMDDSMPLVAWRELVMVVLLS
jgi:hypothetical protein